MQDLARAEAASQKLVTMDDKGQPEIDMSQLQVLRHIVHAGVSRKERVFGDTGQNEKQQS